MICYHWHPFFRLTQTQKRNNSMDIKYKIEFYTDWHCGSGLSSGSDLDALVVKDKNGLPFIPGKTMKGLIREALEDIKTFSGSNLDLVCILGEEANNEKEFDKQGSCFFKNAELEESLQKAIIANNLQEHLFHSIASTSIDNSGVAKEHSLRKMEVAIPCVLDGEILDIPESEDNDYYFLFQNAIKYIKRIGQNRNRGLGRCSISILSPIIKEEGGEI